MGGEGGTGKSDPGPGAATSVTANKGDFLEFSVRGGQSTPPQGTIAPPEDSLHRAQVTRQLCHHETIATTWTTLRNHHRRRCPKMFAFVLLFYLATCPHCHILELSTFLWFTLSYPVLKHTSYLSLEPRVYPCKFFLAGVNFYRFNAKNWHFWQILHQKVAFFTDLTQKIGVFRCKFYSPKILPV